MGASKCHRHSAELSPQGFWRDVTASRVRNTHLPQGHYRLPPRNRTVVQFKVTLIGQQR